MRHAAVIGVSLGDWFPAHAITSPPAHPLIRLPVFRAWPLCAAHCLFAALLITAATGALAARPSFDCGQPKLAKVEKLVCGDDKLAALDARMALTYAGAAAQAVRWKLPLPDQDQQAWLRTRGACVARPDARACLAELYARRIAELQASYLLVHGRAPVELTCGGEAVSLYFFDTEPATLVVHRAGVATTLFQEKTAGGSRYAGGDRVYSEHQGEMRLAWGAGAPALRCKSKP